MRFDGGCEAVPIPYYLQNRIESRTFDKCMTQILSLCVLLLSFLFHIVDMVTQFVSVFRKISSLTQECDLMMVETYTFSFASFLCDLLAKKCYGQLLF